MGDLDGDGDGDGDPGPATPAEGPPQHTAAARIETALAGLLRQREGAALVRLLADPTAARPGRLADAIAVWVRALRMLLTRTLQDAQDEAGAAEQAERLLRAGAGDGPSR